jgi:hypothetical protein
VADFEDRVEVLDWNRNRIDRIRNLTHEAAILAHRVREPQSHAGGPIVQHFLEYALVLGNRTEFAGFLDRRLTHGRPRGSVLRACASLAPRPKD